MGQHELLVLGRRPDLLAHFLRPQCAIDQCHCHRLSLALPECQAVAAGKARSLRGRAPELVDRLAFRNSNPPQRNREAHLLSEHLDLNLAEPDFPCERMGAAVTALRRVAERKEKSFIATCQVLKPHVAPGRQRKRFAGEITGSALRIWM